MEQHRTIDADGLHALPSDDANNDASDHPSDDVSDHASDDVVVAELDTPVGRLSLAVTRAGVAMVGWCDPEHLGARSKLPVVADDERAGPVVEQLIQYFGGERRDFDVPLDWRYTSGTRQAILRMLHANVPYGTSVTYGELAARHGGDVPARAVGGIMGSNPLPIVVPCHRVLAHDGLGGYSGGVGRDSLEVKRWLLTLEGALPPTLDWDPSGI